MRLRRTSVIVMLTLLASAATAYAECAWVLWQFDGVWTTLMASPQREECDRERVTHYGQERTPPPGVGTALKTKDGNIFIRYVCLPDTVDPRGVKK